MPIFNADLHIHSPYSIAVSQNMSLETLTQTAKLKGLHILSTGDITQPHWRKYLQENLKINNGNYSYKDIAFVLGTELEDQESIHHLVLLPDFNSAKALQDILAPFTKNIEGRWAGRPHVQKIAAELVEIIENVGGICGPAHAFTPFKSIFRKKYYSDLQSAYGTSIKKISFLELGLSANTDLADRLECLQNITFLSNSDAHSEHPISLGREFNAFEIEAPTFDEIKNACLRKKKKKVIGNFGLDPKLGKYYSLFCSKCRRRVLFGKTPTIPIFKENLQKIAENILYNDQIIQYSNLTDQIMTQYLENCRNNLQTCPLCKLTASLEKNEKKNSRPTKIPTISLGVFERINELASWETPHHPPFRPPYTNLIPLIEVVKNMLKIKSNNSKQVFEYYNTLICNLGSEYSILYLAPLSELESKAGKQFTSIIQKLRNNEINILSGGGGTYGQVLLTEN